jgi:hypothetical protein
MASNQLSAAELAELKKYYQQIDGLSQSAAENAANQAQQLGNARSQLERLRREYQDWTSDIDSSLQSFKEISSELNKFRTGINDSKKSYSSLESIAQKIQYHQKGINTLSSKELENLQKKAKQEKVRLENAQKTLENDKTRLLSEQQRYENIIRQKEIIGANTDKEYRKLFEIEGILNNINKAYIKNGELLNSENAALDHTVETLSEALKIQQKIEKSMGITGMLFDGLAKVPFVGQLTQAETISKEVQAEIQDIYNTEGRIVSKTEAMGMAFKKLGPKVVESLTDPLALSTFFFKQIFELFKSVDKGAGELAKSTNMSYDSALKLRGELSSIAAASEDNFLLTNDLAKSYTAIGQSLGAVADINKKDLVTFTKLREQAGYTDEELTSIYKTSLVTGETLEDTVTSFLGGAAALSAQKGLSINVKQLMQETAKASAATKLSLVGGAKGLAEAAVKAKELGINLDQADKIAGSLLNFEDSISSELEAELLTGKDINLERARLAAINNDLGGMAEAINQELGGSAEFGRMNRLQQEAIAKSMGMQREELAAALIEQEGLKRVGAATAEEAKKRYNSLRDTLTAEEAAKQLGDEQLANQFEQQSAAERLQKTVEKIRDMFAEVLEGPIAGILSGFANLLKNSTALKAVIYGLSIVAGIWAANMVAAAIAAVTTASAATLGLAAIGIIAGITAVSSAMDSASQNSQKNVKPVTQTGDFSYDPNGGLIMMHPQEGALAQLSKKDGVVAGPVAGNNNGIDYDKLAQAFANVQLIAQTSYSEASYAANRGNIPQPQIA